LPVTIKQISMSVSFGNQILRNTENYILVIVVAHATIQMVITYAHADLD
jgi:hypothetical protein